MPEHIAGKRKHGARLGSVGGHLGGLAGLHLLEIDRAGRACLRIDKHDNPGTCHGLGVLGRKLRADQGEHTGQGMGFDGFHHHWTRAVILAQGVAVSDD